MLETSFLKGQSKLVPVAILLVAKAKGQDHIWNKENSLKHSIIEQDNKLLFTF